MWEYTSKTTRDPSITPSLLNRLGDEGWELVSVTSHMDKYMNFMTTAYFKREKEQQHG